MMHDTCGRKIITVGANERASESFRFVVHFFHPIGKVILRRTEHTPNT